MSWSISFIGTPEKVQEALEAHSSKLSGISQEEYNEALPHLVGLVKLNYSENVPLVRITASGSSYSQAGLRVQNSCQAHLETLYGVMV